MPPAPAAPQTDFGFADIPAAEKTARVGGVFSAVSPYYDLLNNILSGGAHHYWKSAAALLLAARPGMRVLDIAAGSGDMSARLRRHGGKVIAADINLQMLRAGKNKNTAAVQCDAENLPFPARAFDRVVCAFGLRNITNKPAALAEMRRVAKPGGKVGILEFSPRAHFPKLQRLYLLRALPALGKLAAGDAESYRYLGESILRFPPPEEVAAMLTKAGFAAPRCYKFAAGAAALHIARRKI